MDIPKWMMRDPTVVAERLEEMRQAQQKESRQDKAARQLKELFKESPDESDNK